MGCKRMSLRTFNSMSLFLCYNVHTTKEQMSNKSVSLDSGSIERNKSTNRTQISQRLYWISAIRC